MKKQSTGTARVIRRLVMLASATALLLSISGCGGGRSERAASPAAESTPAGGSASAAADARARSESRVGFLERRSAADPLDVFSLNELAIEHMQRARETGDVASLSRAATALARSLERRPEDNYEALALSASLAATQHDFARGLNFAQRAVALKPKAAYAYGALGDAHMGLGRYADAALAYGTMHELEHSVSSFSRLALLAHIEGRDDAAFEDWHDALALALDEDVAEHQAWVRTQIANLSFNTGDVDGAGAQYAAALEIMPDYVHALAGQGRVAAARGDLDAAASRYEAAIELVPLPEYVIALGDVFAAAGDARRAADQYELVDGIEQLYNANGVNLDVQIGLFNADHRRDLPATVGRAQALFDEQPSIAAADALAWVRYQVGDVPGALTAIDAALRTGIREPLVLFHAGMIHKAAGNATQAEQYLSAVRDANANFSLRHAQTAREALQSLTAEAASR